MKNCLGIGRPEVVEPGIEGHGVLAEAHKQPAQNPKPNAFDCGVWDPAQANAWGGAQAHGGACWGCWRKAPSLGAMCARARARGGRGGGLVERGAKATRRPLCVGLLFKYHMDLSPITPADPSLHSLQ